MKKLSVIVPIYNSESYLEKCLKSICEQSYKNLEIILIDDKSNDNSQIIYNNYKSYDKRIKIFKNKQNRGLSYTRNYGIKEVTGDYIAFIDSDDFIEKNMFEEMMKYTPQNDIVICGVNYINENGKKINTYIPNDVKLEEICRYSFACNKIFKKELFKEIKFPESKIYEDYFTIPKLYLKSKHVKIVKNTYYNYIQRENSLSHKRDFIKIFDLLEAYANIYNYLKKNNYDLESYRKILVNNKKYFILNIFSLQTFGFKLKQCIYLHNLLRNLEIFNMFDDIYIIISIFYPRYFIRKIYNYLKKN